MPSLRLRAFAGLKSHLPSELTLDVPLTSIAALKHYLGEHYSHARELLNASRFAVDDRYVEDTFALQGHETVDVLPPVSGG